MINQRPIIDTAFEEYLKEQYVKENEEALDDDAPDGFDTWLSSLDVSEVIEYGNQFGEELLVLLDKANQHDDTTTAELD